MTSPELSSTPPQLDHAQVLALGAENPHWFGEHSPRLNCEVLGRGESFTAWLLGASNGPQVVVRIPRRPVAELSQAMDTEFTALKRAPQDLTAKPVAMHSPTPEDPRAYLVTTRVPGHVRSASAWTTADFSQLAEQLARLHVHAAGKSGIEFVVHDPVGDAQAALAWWRCNHPEAATIIDPLIPGFLHHQARVAAEAPQAEQCFIHGDVSLANVLIDSHARPRLVDWEWSGWADPAKDLAYSGGAVFVEPFYAAMPDAQIRTQAKAYASERERLGAPVDLDSLLIRRSAYLLHEVLFTSAHFWRVAQDGGEEAELYARRSELMRERISDHLSRDF